MRLTVGSDGMLRAADRVPMSAVLRSTWPGPHSVFTGARSAIGSAIVAVGLLKSIAVASLPQQMLSGRLPELRSLPQGLRWRGSSSPTASRERELTADVGVEPCYAPHRPKSCDCIRTVQRSQVTIREICFM